MTSDPAGTRALALEYGPVNSCSVDGAEDARGRAEVTLRFGGIHGYSYVPRCVRVSIGTRVHIEGDFSTHPLAPGREVVTGVGVEPGSPFEAQERGSRQSAAMEAVGAYGFFCDNHLHEGMAGAIFVE